MSNLLGLPGEVRLLILQLLLAKNSGSSRAIDLTDSVVIKFGETLESKLSFPTSLEQFPQYSTLLPVNINVGSVQILQTCKQVSREGAFVLYSMHRFSAVQASAFRTRFIPSIGSFNSSCVKSVHLRAPPCSEHEPSVLFARFVHFLSCRMANLQNLSLSTNVYKYGDPQPALNGSSVWAREHSLMLWTAAWITLRHTQMKRAVWSEVSLNSYSPEPDREGSIMIFVRFTVPGTEWGKSLKGGIKDRCEEVGTSDHQHRPYEVRTALSRHGEHFLFDERLTSLRTSSSIVERSAAEAG